MTTSEIKPYNILIKGKLITDPNQKTQSFSLDGKMTIQDKEPFHIIMKGIIQTTPHMKKQESYDVSIKGRMNVKENPSPDIYIVSIEGSMVITSLGIVQKPYKVIMNGEMEVEPVMTTVVISADYFASMIRYGGLYSSVWGGSNYITLSTSNRTIGQITGYFYINRAIFYFDTTIIPADAIIESAYMKIYNAGNTGIEFNTVIQNGQPTYPHDTPVASDYDRLNYNGNGGSISSFQWVGGINGFVDIPLNTDGLTWITKGGTTKLCIRSDKDISGNTPTSTDIVYINNVSPTLTIEYKLPISCKTVSISTSDDMISQISKSGRKITQSPSNDSIIIGSSKKG